MAQVLVKKQDERPAREDGTCFYCRVPVGGNHEPDCVIVCKRIRMRMVIDYERDVPASWDVKQIEFHHNEGTWCANNALADLDHQYSGDTDCICGITRFEFVEVVDPGPFHSDGG